MSESEKKEGYRYCTDDYLRTTAAVGAGQIGSGIGMAVGAPLGPVGVVAGAAIGGVAGMVIGDTIDKIIRPDRDEHYTEQ